MNAPTTRPNDYAAYPDAKGRFGDYGGQYGPSHKLNNCMGQILLAMRMGKTRIIAETGAGQHGVATATVCARFGLPCVVYMGSVDVERQKPNVLRMNLPGAEAG